MRKLIIISGFYAVATLSGCGYFIGTTVTEEIPDLSKKYDKVIKADLPKGQFVHSVKAKVSGRSSGKFLLNDKKFRAGKIDTILYKGDFYIEDFSFSYEPLEDNEGHLKVSVTYYHGD